MHQTEGRENRSGEGREQDVKHGAYEPPIAEDIDTILSPAEVASGTEALIRIS